MQGSLKQVRLVCATRENRHDFFQKTALGRSLSLYKSPLIELQLFDQNRSGLPALYNRAIDDSKGQPAVLVFLHDDIHLCDYFWYNHLLDALDVFEIVGLAGNKRRVANQPAWAFIDERFTWDGPENLSGVVGHGLGFPPHRLSFFGAPIQEVKLLDGLLLGCHSHTLHAKNLRFDERFDFHFYDMDLCRQAEAKNVRMGTWPISVVHESSGNFATPAWHAAFQKYLAKWGS